MATRTFDLWSLALDHPQVDAQDLADAVAQQAAEQPLDYRTRLLIRDSLDALARHWGEARIARWLTAVPAADRLRTIRLEPFEEIGFPSLPRRLLDKTKPETIRQFLEEAGRSLHQPVRIDVGGAVALILAGYVQRRTEDIDVVGEVPRELRENHALMHSLQQRFALYLGQLQTRYFPKGWQQRTHSLDRFGRLQVSLLDVYDIALSKLFSVREKDRDDLRVLLPQLDRAVLLRKFKESAGDFLAEPRLKEIATDNWQILFSEGLPT